MIGITILGATGSVGVNTLDVVSSQPQRFRVVALTANTEVERMYQQCLVYRPEYAVMADSIAAEQLQDRLGSVSADTHVLTGVEGLQKVAALPQTDYVMAAIVGSAGLLPTLAAARAGKRILLANKESLVMAGNLFMDEVHKNNALLLPIDSEHNAVFQCMPQNFSSGLRNVGVTRILLTSSGGPFRTTPLDQLGNVTPEQACAHPNWVMGRKISVDSATMMNKGLEVIEACCLFGADADVVQVVVHPQSVIHSMVEYVDGSLLAHLASPDMRIPIAHALAWPERMSSGVEPLNLFDVSRLDFERPDTDRFPCLRLAYEAIRQGGAATTVLNAANEVAVQAFLDRRLPFMDIPSIIEMTLSDVTFGQASTLSQILEVDRTAREAASCNIKMMVRRVIQ
ncbi:MAG TPA: 1-deoxy-D-xylulose-5-phosphate reductoisomerase [Gammaproteobacteria bacterium]